MYQTGNQFHPSLFQYRNVNVLLVLHVITSHRLSGGTLFFQHMGAGRHANTETGAGRKDAIHVDSTIILIYLLDGQ